MGKSVPRSAGDTSGIILCLEIEPPVAAADVTLDNSVL